MPSHAGHRRRRYDRVCSSRGTEQAVRTICSTDRIALSPLKVRTASTRSGNFAADATGAPGYVRVILRGPGNGAPRGGPGEVEHVPKARILGRAQHCAGHEARGGDRCAHAVAGHAHADAEFRNRMGRNLAPEPVRRGPTQQH